MREMSSTGWQRRGSSVIFDRDTLAPLIDNKNIISLRTALGWMQQWPDKPPFTGTACLVCGLETVIDLLEPGDAEQFLRTRIRPLIQEFQAKWDQLGLIFGFSSSLHSFHETTADEDVVWKRHDQSKIHLSRYLWNGSSTLNLARIISEDPHKNNITVGYHVQRIS
jgi:hypothetical protein